MAMTKVIMNIGYNEYVVDLADAVTVMEVMAKAEKYKAKYNSGGYTHHVWDDGGDNPVTFIKPINENLYRTAKLAGEPKDD
jgi:hypothetical protein